VKLLVSGGKFLQFKVASKIETQRPLIANLIIMIESRNLTQNINLSLIIPFQQTFIGVAEKCLKILLLTSYF
jgi:hypothetical protein